jgi:xanthine dehydrogenase large subunit
MEPQAAVAWPDGEGLRVWSSTQNPSEVQAAVARMLGVARNRISCECHHVGGGFGGKETQCVLPACMAALVARHSGRPARVAYRRADDLRSTGKRHAFRCDYRVGFDERGRILALGLDFWADGGAFTDLSPAVVDRAVLHGENAYFIPDLEFRGTALRTNRAPSTAMRGFGAPQAVAAVENAIEEIAQLLRRDAFEIRSLNLYGRAEAGEAAAVTPYGQVIRNNLLPEILPRLAEGARYRERRAAIEAHNASPRRQLRGIALTPVKFGISFTVPHLNQANALVHVFTDGSVQVSTGATEIGQGVNTKIQQLVADALGIELGSVRVLPTSTERSHNTSPTAASVSTDLNGAAVLDACARIRERLERMAAAELGSPEVQIGFAELCERAWRARIDLGARGFFATPGLHFSWSLGRGEPFHYFTTGAAVSEVEIDRFTGAVRVLRADLLLDIGRRINPGIDDGQVIGGFVQALGWCTSELLVYDDAGWLCSDSGATYKIPGVADAPERLELGYIESDNSLGIAGSKAVGEPPFLLGISVWMAVKHALSCVDPGAIPQLALPATGERVLRLLTELEEARRTE